MCITKCGELIFEMKIVQCSFHFQRRIYRTAYGYTWWTFQKTEQDDWTSESYVYIKLQQLKSVMYSPNCDFFINCITGNEINMFYYILSLCKLLFYCRNSLYILCLRRCLWHQSDFWASLEFIVFAENFKYNLNVTWYFLFWVV